MGTIFSDKVQGNHTLVQCPGTRIPGARCLSPKLGLKGDRESGLEWPPDKS